jgi:lysophospholipid acyltransferase (LPLAT)-like uncharacterized protein
MSMAVVLVRALLRLWLFTLRIRRTGPPFDRPAVIVFWHGDQFPLLAVRPSAPVAAAVSRSRDGSLQAGILGGLGVVSVRGSSSRGGAHAARGLLRALRAGWPVLLAVDGPRGPRGSVAPGAAFLAGRTGFPVQAVGVAVRRGRRIQRAWDRFLLPCPFTRVEVVVSPPLFAHDGETQEALTGRIAEALRQVTFRARDGIRKPTVKHAPDHEGGVD